jgi:hypothetical protein
VNPIASPAPTSPGRVKASDRKMTSGCSRRELVDAPLPEPERLGVGVVDAEDPHALADPVVEHALQRLPQPRRRPRSRSRAGRCPGTSSAGSRRTGWSRRAVLEPLGVLVTQGWSGEHWKAMSIASSSRGSQAAATQPRRSSIGAELGVDRGVAALRRRSPTASPTSSGSAVDELLRPLRWRVPIGWIGGRYSTSKPMPARTAAGR